MSSVRLGNQPHTSAWSPRRHQRHHSHGTPSSRHPSHRRGRQSRAGSHSRGRDLRVGQRRQGAAGSGRIGDIGAVPAGGAGVGGVCGRERGRGTQLGGGGGWSRVCVGQRGVRTAGAGTGVRGKPVPAGGGETTRKGDLQGSRESGVFRRCVAGRITRCFWRERAGCTRAETVITDNWGCSRMWTT